MAQAEQPQCYCVRCQKMKPRKDFYPCFHRTHINNVTYYCKDCCGDIAKEQFDINASFEYNMRNICAILDLPYVKELSDKLSERLDKGTKERQVNIVFNYIKVLKDNIPEDKLKQYWQDLSGASYYGIDILKVAKLTSEGDIELMMELEKTWGKLENIYQYLFVEEKYEQYSAGQELSPAASATLRNCCLTELDIRNGRAKGEDTSKLEEKLTKYYKSLKLDNFNVSGDKPLIEKTIEDWAVKQEETEPLDWVDEHLEDITHFRDDYQDIMRCIGNKALGLKQYPNLTAEDIKKEKKKKKGVDSNAN